jgi:dienelactone hydrolase
MLYREEKQKTKAAKQTYVDGIEGIIRSRQAQAQKLRDQYFQDIFKTPETYRQDLRQMFGWPLLGQAESSLPKVTWEELAQEQDHTVYRLGFEILDGMTMTGLFFRAKGPEARPLVIVQHGGQGTPEHISNFYGNTTNYHHMLERVIAHGVHAFAPQLLLWKGDQYEVSYDRQKTDARLKRVGSSITAVEVYGITRILDYFEAQSYVTTFGMVGMSYGGFYALVTAAVDTRIKAAVSCAFFNTRDEIGWCDWTWQCSAEKFDDAEIACLVYPRKLHILIADADPLFDHVHGVASFERLCRICEKADTDWVDLTVFEGGHEFCKDDAAIQRLMAEIETA